MIYIMANILIIEDNHDYLEVLQNFLESAGHTITAVYDGTNAADLIQGSSFDLVLLDLMLPKTDGYSVCEMIRKHSDIPVIMLTALGSEAHQLHGFELMIDDYITKPVSMPILLNRVAAVLRRTSPCEPEQLKYRSIFLDLKGHTVSVRGIYIEFTLREFEILTQLMQSPGEVVTRKALLSKLWDYNYYGDARIVDTHIKNIRKKLGDEDCIETVRGVGYKLPKAD